MSNQKGFAPVIIILVVLIVLGGVYYFGKVKPVINISKTNQETYFGYLGDGGDIKYTIKHPSEMILSKGNCDPFVLPSSDTERKKIKEIRDQNMEIGYTIEGLEVSFCVLANPNKLEIADLAKQHSSNSNFSIVDFNNYNGVRSEGFGFTEYFINSPGEEIVRIWYRYGDTKYKDIANQILSTFKFTN